MAIGVAVVLRGAFTRLCGSLAIIETLISVHSIKTLYEIMYEART